MPLAVSEHTVSLITTGISLGVLHVLAGPDHLSALAALSVGSSWRAFTLGFRWGIGHSTGLVVVAIVFISLKGELDLRTMGRYCDSLVGIFMIALGCYGVLGAIKMYREKHNKRDSDLTDRNVSTILTSSPRPTSFTSNNSPSTNSDTTSNLTRKESNTDFLSNTSHGSNQHLEVENADDDEESNLLKNTNNTHSSDTINIISQYSHHNNHNQTSNNINDEHDDHHHHSIPEDCGSWCPFIDMHDPYTQRVVSFSIGLLHGVAGPGGILGVLPAVEMQNYTSSFLYLSSFIIASTLSMGTFAALYGELTKRIGATAESIELGLNIFSSAMSIIVGTIWFVLSVLGKLEGLFH